MRILLRFTTNNYLVRVLHCILPSLWPANVSCPALRFVLVASFLRISNLRLESFSSRPTIGRSQQMFSWPLFSAALFMSCSRTVRESRYQLHIDIILYQHSVLFLSQIQYPGCYNIESDYNNTSSLTHCQLCVLMA